MKLLPMFFVQGVESRHVFFGRDPLGGDAEKAEMLTVLVRLLLRWLREYLFVIETRKVTHPLFVRGLHAEYEVLWGCCSYLIMLTKEAREKSNQI